MKHMTYGILVAMTLLLACQQISDTRADEDLSAIKSQLADIEEIFLSSEVPLETKFRQYLEFFVDDPVLLQAGEDEVLGYDATLAFYTDAFEGGKVIDLDFQAPDILLEGDMAVRRYI